MLGRRWLVTLRFSEHRRELAREACLRQLGLYTRRRPSTVVYDPLYHCRHNARDRSIKVGREIKTYNFISFFCY